MSWELILFITFFLKDWNKLLKNFGENLDKIHALVHNAFVRWSKLGRTIFFPSLKQDQKLWEKKIPELNFAQVQILIFKHKKGLSAMYSDQKDIMAQATLLTNILNRILIQWNHLSRVGQT